MRCLFVTSLTLSVIKANHFHRLQNKPEFRWFDCLKLSITYYLTPIRNPRNILITAPVLSAVTVNLSRLIF